MWLQSCLFLIFAVTSIVAHSHGATSIDVSRARYLEIETNLWTTLGYTNQLNGLKETFREHRKFVTEYVDPIMQFISNDGFIALNPIYEWNYLQQDLLVLNNLFEALRVPLDKYVDDFDELALNDFTDTILHDERFPVNGTLDQIENIMVKQALYYRAMLVCICSRHRDRIRAIGSGFFTTINYKRSHILKTKVDILFQEAKSQVCATRQSAQQVLYQLYTAISLTELKGYAMMQFSWMLLKSYGKGKFHKQIFKYYVPESVILT